MFLPIVGWRWSATPYRPGSTSSPCSPAFRLSRDRPSFFRRARSAFDNLARMVGARYRVVGRARL